MQPERARPAPPATVRAPLPAVEPLVVRRYGLRLAADEATLDAALRLRYRVFNLELGEGLAGSAASGRDEDRFDRGEVVGTYRLQTEAMALAGAGFYSDGEYDLAALPASVRARALEVGRACIAREHRSRTVLFLLWLGLARYMMAAGCRYLFGCCSLTSQDPRQGAWAAASLARRGCWHPTLAVPARPAVACVPAPGWAAPAAEFALPTLFETYLRYGAKVIGPAAIDREFKTIDFLVLLDVEGMDPRTRALFFGRDA